jgi:hypothetical protein
MGTGATGGMIGVGGTAGAGVVVPDSGYEDACNSFTIEFEKLVPSVLLLVDRSSSMWEGYATSPTRWEPLKQALVGPTGVVPALQAEVYFGFMAYTGQEGNPTCPVLNQVPVALNNLDAIVSEYEVASIDPAQEQPRYTKGETPTGIAIRRATEALEAVTQEGPKYILLATDGEPDSCDKFYQQCGQDESIAAVQAAFEKGIRTIVVGLGTAIGEQHLLDVANAGSGQPVQRPSDDAQVQSWWVQCGRPPLTATYGNAGGNAVFYSPANPVDLESKLREAFAGVRSCAFDLNGIIEITAPTACDVAVDGNALGFQDPDGWSLVGDTRVELSGAGCQAIQDTNSERFDIACPCSAVVIPE